MFGEVNEQELRGHLQKSKAGDTNSFGLFYKLMYNVFYLYGLHYEDSKSNVEDYVQGYFLQILTNIDPFINADNLKAYLLKGFKNYILTQRKKYKSSTNIDSDRINDSSLNPELKKCKEEDHYLISRYCKKEFSCLSPKEQKLVYLRYYCEMEPRIIANVLDMNPQVVRNLIYRAIVKLRKKLSSKKEVRELLRVALQNLNILF